MCSQPMWRSPRRLASSNARSSPRFADAPQRGLVRRQLAETSTPLASIPTRAEHALEVALDRVAQLLRVEADVAQGGAGGVVRARERDEQVLRLDARGPEPGRDRVGLERDLARLADESLKHPSASSRASCGRPAA